MSPKLRSLLVGGIGGIATVIAGTAVVLYVPTADTTRADLVDAGVTADFTPRKLSCWALIDGGYKQFAPIVAVSKTLNPDGTRDTIWPRSAIPFREALSDENTSCRPVATLTWAQVADFFAAPADDVPPCACNPGDGGCYSADGGAAPMRQTLQPGEFIGPNCVPKLCQEYLRPSGGETSWPARCGAE